MTLETLFSPKKIGNVQIKNRIVRSATFMNITEKYGYIGDKFIERYDILAQGGTGLIITEATAVDPSGSGGPYQACLFDDSHNPGHIKLVNKVHEYSETKIGIQLVHTGRLGYHPKYPTVAPSPIHSESTGITPRELTTEEINEFIQKFVSSGIRAYECGYDMVQLHAAHGYFLCNFLSPFTNKRNDEFGGSIQNKTKILTDIYNGLRDEIGKKFPILIKLQVVDAIPNGLIEEEGIKLAKILAEAGFDAIEPSGGSRDSQMFERNALPSKVVKKPEDENYFLPIAKKIKPLLKNCALILVGGIRNPLLAEKILQDNEVDFISLSRPLIYEPELPNRWQKGDTTPTKCISCNSCFTIMEKGIPVYCVTKKNLEKQGNSKTVL
ncbi:MAG: NADH:flavin oxidoreductase [Promethearchaeota archaeon]